VWFLSPKGASDLSLLQNFETGFGDQPASHSISEGKGKVPPLTVAQQRHEADHCRSGSARVNGWNYVFKLPICLHVMYRDALHFRSEISYANYLKEVISGFRCEED